MNVLSLFDGMSCGRIALERAGIEVTNYFSSEVDKFAIQIANKNWPQDEKNRLGDVTKININDLPKIDLLIGGSPCQSFSFAGKKKGMSTKCAEEITTLERYLELKAIEFEFEGQSYLFWEFVKVLKETKPKYFLLENVKMSEMWEGVISKTLGYAPKKINSSLVSAQSRLRLYWTNIELLGLPNNKNLVLSDILEEDVNTKYYMNKPLVLNGKTEGKIGDLDYKDNDRQRRVYSDATKSPSLLARADSPRILKIGDLTMKASQQVRRVYSTEGLNPTLDTMQGGHRQPKVLIDNEVRKLTPLECERLQTIPDNYTEGVSNSQRYKMVGNGWTADVIAHIFKGLK
tara:strand:- start:939 stop:1973 length:1035 start_codon:yes stop_codon:yes gene_type:complete